MVPPGPLPTKPGPLRSSKDTRVRPISHSAPIRHLDGLYKEVILTLAIALRANHSRLHLISLCSLSLFHNGSPKSRLHASHVYLLPRAPPVARQVHSAIERTPNPAAEQVPATDCSTDGQLYQYGVRISILETTDRDTSPYLLVTRATTKAIGPPTLFREGLFEHSRLLRLRQEAAWHRPASYCQLEPADSAHAYC